MASKGSLHVKKLHQVDVPLAEHLSASTQWRRKRGKPSMGDKAANQQYLTP